MFGSAPSLKILVMANQMAPSGEKNFKKNLIVQAPLIYGSMKK